MCLASKYVGVPESVLDLFRSRFSGAATTFEKYIRAIRRAKVLILDSEISVPGTSARCRSGRGVGHPKRMGFYRRRCSPRLQVMLLQDLFPTLCELTHWATNPANNGTVDDWNLIAQKIEGRSNKDCRKRFYNGVAGGLKKVRLHIELQAFIVRSDLRC
jgi:hypothetical protein